jgi:hypothetical protein
MQLFHLAAVGVARRDGVVIGVQGDAELAGGDASRGVAARQAGAEQKCWRARLRRSGRNNL